MPELLHPPTVHASDYNSKYELTLKMEIDVPEQPPQLHLRRKLDRQHPFVPSLEGNFVAGSFHNLQRARSNSIARSHGLFPIIQETNARKRDGLMSCENMEALCKRAEQLSKCAIGYSMDKFLNEAWEADMKQHLFGRMGEDPLLKIDKTYYKYQCTIEETSQAFVRTSCPDLTFGLATFDTVTILHWDSRNKHAPKDERIPVNAFLTLSRERVINQLSQRRCGLVVDPKWESADLVFPWGIFQTKETFAPLEDVELRLYEAASVYLSMLDDLSRNPKKPKKYQDRSGGRPRLFGFVCSREQLWIYTMFDDHGRCLVEPLWAGNLSNEHDAFTAVAIMDQIHDWAVTTHRLFVIKHLEPWLQLAEADVDYSDSQKGTDIFEREEILCFSETDGLGCFTNVELPLWKEIGDKAPLGETKKRKGRVGELGEGKRARCDSGVGDGVEPMEF